MSDKVESVFESFSKYIDSEEGQRSIEEFQRKLDTEEQNRKRLHVHHGKDIDPLIEKILNRYDGAYRDKEYKKGYEPRCPLYNVLYDYAEKYGCPTRNKKYVNQFTANQTAYYVGSYCIQLIHGQGSAILIDKLDRVLNSQKTKGIPCIIGISEHNPQQIIIIETENPDIFEWLDGNTFDDFEGSPEQAGIYRCNLYIESISPQGEDCDWDMNLWIDEVEQIEVSLTKN